MVPAGLVLCVHTDVSLAHCSCRSRTVNQMFRPAAAPQFESEASGELPASPLGSLYKGITIIRCLINPYRHGIAICLGHVTAIRSGRSRTSLRCDPRYNSLGCNLPRAHRPPKLKSA